MLNILYKLHAFFEDCYREIGVREYARILKISAPTASKILKEFEAKELLKKRLERGYLLFRANRENSVLKDLSRIYWRYKLGKLIDYLSSKFYSSGIVLFGSLTKLEVKKDSDIDLAIFTGANKKINLSNYEKDLKRGIQIFNFKSLDSISNKNLRNNILNGYLIHGEYR